LKPLSAQIIAYETPPLARSPATLRLLTMTSFAASFGFAAMTLMLWCRFRLPLMHLATTYLFFIFATVGIVLVVFDHRRGKNAG
jgi:hypothetical protein